LQIPLIKFQDWKSGREEEGHVNCENWRTSMYARFILGKSWGSGFKKEHIKERIRVHFWDKGSRPQV
jgi:hypothetical protein